MRDAVGARVAMLVREEVEKNEGGGEERGKWKERTVRKTVFSIPFERKFVEKRIEKFEGYVRAYLKRSELGYT